MSVSRARRSYTIATIFPLDTTHGHGLLRGVAQFVHDHPQVRVLRFGFVRPEALTPKFLQSLAVDGLIVKINTDAFASDDEIVSRALEHIRDHVGNTIYVDEVARVVGCSRRTLELRFRATLGTSVYEEVQRQHLEHAKELLANPALTLAEVADASGYEDANHLGLAFRRQVGTTPGKFRAELMIASG